MVKIASIYTQIIRSSPLKTPGIGKLSNIPKLLIYFSSIKNAEFRALVSGKLQNSQKYSHKCSKSLNITHKSLTSQYARPEEGIQCGALGRIINTDGRCSRGGLRRFCGWLSGYCRLRLVYQTNIVVTFVDQVLNTVA